MNSSQPIAEISSVPDLAAWLRLHGTRAIDGRPGAQLMARAGELGLDLFFWDTAAWKVFAPVLPLLGAMLLAIGCSAPAPVDPTAYCFLGMHGPIAAADRAYMVTVADGVPFPDSCTFDQLAILDLPGEGIDPHMRVALGISGSTVTYSCSSSSDVLPGRPQRIADGGGTFLDEGNCTWALDLVCVPDVPGAISEIHLTASIDFEPYRPSRAAVVHYTVAYADGSPTCAWVTGGDEGVTALAP